MTIFGDHVREILEPDRCPNCGLHVYGVLHFCGTTATPDAVAAVERVAENVRAGLDKATRNATNGNVA